MRHFVVPVIIAVAMALAIGRSLQAQTNLPPELVHYADMVLYNGKILTADEKFSSVEAVAIREGRILVTGKSDYILQMAGPKTLRIDLKGKMVIPGIVDLHEHPFTEGMMYAWNHKWLPELPIREYGEEWTDGNEVLKGIRSAVAKAKPGEFVMIPRTYVQQGIAGGGGIGKSVCQVVTLKQIDEASGDVPVFFIGIVNLTAFAVNSKAATLIKPLIKGNDPVFREEGKACLATGGDIDGILPPSVQAVNDFIYWSRPLEEQLADYREASHFISSRGITLAKEHTALPLTTGIRELWARGDLTVRMRMPYPLTPVVSGNTVQIPPEDAETLFRRIGNMSDIGDDMLRFLGIRPPAVGGNMMGGDEWTFDPKVRPYPDRWGNPSPYGGRPGEGGKEAFRGREAMVQAVRYGWNVSADHVVGDRAVHEVLLAFQEGLENQLVKRPNQHLTINHTPNARLDDIKLMKQLGVDASIGSWHVFAKPMLEAGLIEYGTERIAHMLPMQSYITEGMKPALEGDTFDYPTFWRLEKAITKKDDTYQRTWNPSEAVTRQQALWMVTSWPALQIGEEKKLGTIEAGKYADLVVIDRDYMTVPEDSIHEIKILMTILGGKIVHEVEGAVR